MLGGAPARVGPAERLIVNGMPAMVLPAIIQTENGDVELDIAVYEGPGRTAYHFIVASPPAGAPPARIAELFASFHMLTPQQISSLRPRVIRTLPFTARDSVASLARQMASDHPIEHFLMLNGLASGGTPAPGDLVKIVTFAGR